MSRWWWLPLPALALALAGCVPPPVTVEPPPSTTTVAPSSTTDAPGTTVAPPVTVTPPPVTAPPSVTVTPTITAQPSTVTAPPPHPGRVYPRHTRIVATTFWVGEIFDPKRPDGSQVCSTYDSQWAYHWSGVKVGVATSTDCKGAPTGGCDGLPSLTNGRPDGRTCKTEPRTVANGYFPTSTAVHPLENPFYLDLPFDDVHNAAARAERGSVVPWAHDPGLTGGDSVMKNRWVRIVGPNKNTCYGQIEDAGPAQGDHYDDSRYVFGAGDARPANPEFGRAGADVSPALNGCLGFAELDGDTDQIEWQFVDDGDVPDGPWKRVVTTSPAR